VLRSVFLSALFLSTAVLSVANTISSAAETPGTTYSVTSVTGSETANQLNGATVTATFASGSASCTFVGGTCTGGGSTFSLSLTPGSTLASTWLVTNSDTSALESLSVNLQGATSAFNPCVSGGNAMTTSGECGNSGGTAGTNNSESVSMAGNAANATKGSASVLYANEVALGAAAPKGDLFTQITLSFGTTFTTGQTFTFAAGTDLLAAAASNPIIAAAFIPADPTPEPATLGLVGGSLVGLGLLARRRKKA